MAATQKVSVAIGRTELRLAKTAANEEGVSLSAYVTRAVRERLEERLRSEAAREFLATFAPDEIPTAEEERALVEVWTRARPSPSRSERPGRHERPRARATRTK